MWFRRILSILPVCFLATGLSFPAEGLAEDPPAVEARVDRLLRATSEYLKEARSFTFHAEITTDDVLPTGQKIQFGTSYDAAVRRPDRIRTHFRGDLRNTTSYYDGKNFTVMNHDKNLFATWKAPGSIDNLIAKIEEKLGINIPLSSLFLSDPYKDWKNGIEVGTYAGEHLVFGVPCHHLVLTQGEVDAQVWIEESTQLVVRKVVLTFKAIEGSPQLTALLTDWDFSPKLPDLIFDFVPPEGSSRIEFLPVAK
jgi:hypothetical protein